MKANAPSEQPAISGDGRHVAFDTMATNLADDAGGLDVYVRDVDAGTTRLVSVTGEATKGSGDSFSASIGRDGNRVSFLSTATNFGETGPATRLYVRDSAARTLTVAARADGSGGAALSGVETPLLSADGQHVAFVASPQASIAPGAPGDGLARVYERNLVSGVTRLISRGAGAAGKPLGGSPSFTVVGGITADGGCVTFAGAGDLSPTGSPDFSAVFMRAVTANCGRPWRMVALDLDLDLALALVRTPSRRC